jgi:hypothetical protein
MSTTVILSLVGGVIFVGLIALWIAFKKGENSAEGKQAKADLKVVKRQAEVPQPLPGETEEALRKGKF